MFGLKPSLFIKSFHFHLILFSFIIITLNQNNIQSYGPTTHYRPIWKNEEHIHENEIYSPPVPVLKQPMIPPKLASFGVVPELLSDLEVGKFVYQREFSPKLSQIYSQYLKNEFFTQICAQETGEPPFIAGHDFRAAFQVADQQIKEYELANQEYLSVDPRGLNFSAYVYVSGLHSKYNEFLTEYLSKA